MKLLKYSATTDDFCFKFCQILGCGWNQAKFLIEHIDGQVTQTYLLSCVSISWKSTIVDWELKLVVTDIVDVYVIGLQGEFYSFTSVNYKFAYITKTLSQWTQLTILSSTFFIEAGEDPTFDVFYMELLLPKSNE